MFSSPVPFSVVYNFDSIKSRLHTNRCGSKRIRCMNVKRLCFIRVYDGYDGSTTERVYDGLYERLSLSSIEKLLVLVSCLDYAKLVFILGL